MKRIGLYGGTFDPIHNGHLHLIQQLFAIDLVDEVIVIPAGDPWMRDEKPLASAADRLAMVKLAVSTLPADIASHVIVSDIEIDRNGPTYTIDTVLALQAQRSGVRWLLVMGSDVAVNISKWHRSQELEDLVEFLLIARDGQGVDIAALPISATQVRLSMNVHEKDLPTQVVAYIKEKKLYARK